MASPSKKLAESLELLSHLQNEKGIAIVRASDLTRTHKERLVKNGFLKEVIKGWYISKRPEENDSDTTSWFTSFWDFVSVYVNERFGDEWCLSPEQSLYLLSENHSVPKQLIVRSPKGNNNKIDLIHGTSFFDLKLQIPKKKHRIIKNNIQMYGLAKALIAVNVDFFIKSPVEARTCLCMIKDASEVLSLLLDGEHTIIAGRLAGAFRNIGKSQIADEIITTMKSAGFNAREDDPFKQKLTFAPISREVSPYVNRIKFMWQDMRQHVMHHFPNNDTPIDNIEAYLKRVDDSYLEDAYHSLSIEGYRVTPELVNRVKSGNWDPGKNKEDQEQKNAMAARGYYLAFQNVKESIRIILKGQNAGEVANDDHRSWYRELFTPSVSAGLLKASDLAGYRNGPVYIKGSMHIPPNHEAVREMMPVLFDLLKDETEPGVRVVLGHFIFVYIHPYFDGNGRIARFLMNCMLASGGYPWTVIPVEKRDEYMKALERASVDRDIAPFTKFIGSMLIKKS